MTDEIANYFKSGLVLPTFEAVRSFNIWKNVATEASFLKTQSKNIQLLYSFVQFGAQNSFVLNLGKLYDNPKSKYPTLCIRSFLDRITLVGDWTRIVEDTQTVRTMKFYGCPQNLLDAVNGIDPNDFPKLFVEYYRDRLSSETMKQNIDTLKKLRDKFVAHNEYVSAPAKIEHDAINNLLDLANEIISVYGIAYNRERWNLDGVSTLKRDAERNADFIKVNISFLKS